MNYLAISRCPTHKEVWAVGIEGKRGVRLTPSKCCGNWQTVTRWPMTERLVADFVTEMECAMDPALNRRVDPLDEALNSGDGTYRP